MMVQDEEPLSCQNVARSRHGNCSTVKKIVVCQGELEYFGFGFKKYRSLLDAFGSSRCQCKIAKKSSPIFRPKTALKMTGAVRCSVART